MKTLLALTNVSSKIASVNPRPEFHGEDRELACDIKIQINANNSILNVFDPELREFFYTEGDDDQAGLFDAEQGPSLTKLKHPEIPSIAWAYEVENYQLCIDYGLGGPSNINLFDVKVGKFGIVPQEGGTVAITFRAQAHPEEEEIGKLCSLIQGEVKISLVPPEDISMFEEQQEKQMARARAEAMFVKPDEQPENDDDVVDGSSAEPTAEPEPAGISAE